MRKIFPTVLILFTALGSELASATHLWGVIDTPPAYIDTCESIGQVGYHGWVLTRFLKHLGSFNEGELVSAVTTDGENLQINDQQQGKTDFCLMDFPKTQ